MAESVSTATPAVEEVLWHLHSLLEQRRWRQQQQQQYYIANIKVVMSYCFAWLVRGEATTAVVTAVVA